MMFPSVASDVGSVGMLLERSRGVNFSLTLIIIHARRCNLEHARLVDA